MILKLHMDKTFVTITKVLRRSKIRLKIPVRSHLSVRSS